jgi:hypothetical protein
MKRVAILAFLAAVVLPASAHAVPRGEAKLTVNGKAVTVDYGRPGLAGRDMIGQAKVGDVWRLGADSPTSLKTEAELSFGDKQVAAGQYVLRARREADDKWTLLVVKDGANVAEVPLTPATLKDSVEIVTIELREAKDGGKLVIS